MAEPTRTEAGAVDAERLSAIRKRLQRAYTYEVRVRRNRNATVDVRVLLDALAARDAEIAALRVKAVPCGTCGRDTNDGDCYGCEADRQLRRAEAAERALAACREALAVEEEAEAHMDGCADCWNSDAGCKAYFALRQRAATMRRAALAPPDGAS